MTGLFQRISGGLSDFVNFQADRRTDELFLVSSPLPSILICMFYLLFVKKWGPWMMENRKPFKLDKFMIAYNIGQILGNLSLVILATAYVLPSYNVFCTPIDYSNSPSALMSIRLGYSYFIIKIADLLDTIFMVLRKKHNQVSFLHVYHHCGMVVSTWIGMRYLAGGQTFYVAFLNGIVHIFMYTYYLLTSLDEKYKKSVWWKKHITQIQLVQFLVLLVMFTRVFFDSNCNYPKGILYFYIPQNFLFLYLFGNFYWHAYINPRPKTNKIVEGKEL